MVFLLWNRILAKAGTILEEEWSSMNYEEARAYLDDAARYGSVLGLDTMKELLARLGNPQDDLKFIHIGGTNGKGSVLSYLSTVLKEAGYRVGRYISPTLFSYRERIQVNEIYIKKDALARLTTQIQSCADEMVRDGAPHPTAFEIETALCFLYFREEKCDLVVLEVGMGGAPDATNVIKTPVLEVLASISMDHMGFLGNTLGEIAEHKTGIIKPGCTVVSASQQPEAAVSVRKKAEQEGCELICVEPEKIKIEKRGLEGQIFSYKEHTQVEIALAGEYQFLNGALALEVLDELKRKGYEISEEALKAGMKKTVWLGRFSAIARDPLFIVDGAHNRDAARVFRDSVERDLPGKRLIFIMGVLADKEYEEVVRQTVSLAAEVITVMTPDNPRALPAEELANTVKKYNSHVQAAESLAAAVDLAYEKAEKEDAIVAFGSLSYLGEMTRLVWKKTGREE